MRGCCVLAALVACDSSSKTPQDAPSPEPDAPVVLADPPDLDDRSGTRLKRELAVTSDGFKQQDGWYDSLLSASCRFVRVADGSSRCLPQSGGFLSVMYRDSACTDVVLSGISAPTGSVIRTREGCEGERLDRKSTRLNSSH